MLRSIIKNQVRRVGRATYTTVSKVQGSPKQQNTKQYNTKQQNTKQQNTNQQSAKQQNAKYQNTKQQNTKQQNIQTGKKPSRNVNVQIPSVKRHFIDVAEEDLSAVRPSKTLNMQGFDKFDSENQKLSTNIYHTVGQQIQSLNRGASMSEVYDKLPKPTKIDIEDVKYIKSSVVYEDCPLNQGIPEMALIGQSNVGKSSLINMLQNNKVEVKQVAKTSKVPGTTRMINHFLINKNWYMVDLPGYGFAKVSSDLKSSWGAMTMDYLFHRKNLCHVFLLIDPNIEPHETDLHCVEFLGANEIPFSIVYTKYDQKPKDFGKEGNVKQFENHILSKYDILPARVYTSAVTRHGRTELLTLIARLRQIFKEERKVTT